MSFGIAQNLNTDVRYVESFSSKFNSTEIAFN